MRAITLGHYLREILFYTSLTQNKAFMFAGTHRNTVSGKNFLGFILFGAFIFIIF